MEPTRRTLCLKSVITEKLAYHLARSMMVLIRSKRALLATSQVLLSSTWMMSWRWWEWTRAKHNTLKTIKAQTIDQRTTQAASCTKTICQIRLTSEPTPWIATLAAFLRFLVYFTPAGLRHRPLIMRVKLASTVMTWTVSQSFPSNNSRRTKQLLKSTILMRKTLHGTTLKSKASISRTTERRSRASTRKKKRMWRKSVIALETSSSRKMKSWGRMAELWLELLKSRRTECYSMITSGKVLWISRTWSWKIHFTELTKKTNS